MGAMGISANSNKTKTSVLWRVFTSPWGKISIAVGVVALLIYFNRVDATVLVGVVHTWPWLLAALLLMLPTYVVVSLRFKLILGTQGIHASLSQAIRWTMIGSFFDLAMPSSCGGDLVKIGYLVKHVDAGQGTRAVLVVLFDRLMGMLGLFLLAFLAGVFGWQLLRDLPARNLVVGLTFLASLGTLLFLRLAGSRRLSQNSRIDRLLLRQRWGAQIKDLIASFNALRERPGYLFMALGLSVLNHMFWCASLLCIVKVVGASVAPLKGFVVFPLALFSNLFGVAGGFGVGTAGFDLLLSQFLAIGNGALIGLLFQTLSALARLAGLPFYLFSPPSGEEVGG